MNSDFKAQDYYYECDYSKVTSLHAMPTHEQFLQQPICQEKQIRSSSQSIPKQKQKKQN